MHEWAPDGRTSDRQTSCMWLLKRNVTSNDRQYVTVPVCVCVCVCVCLCLFVCQDMKRVQTRLHRILVHKGRHEDSANRERESRQAERERERDGRQRYFVKQSSLRASHRQCRQRERERETA